MYLQKEIFKIYIILLNMKPIYQSVTAVDASDDHNSYWKIRGKTATDCPRG